MNKWGARSLKSYNTLHTDLKILADYVLPIHDCTLFWGYRTETEQNELFNIGRSTKKYPDSKHNVYPSIAMDLIPWVKDLGGMTWDKEYSLYFSGLVLGVADCLYAVGRMNHRIRAGVNWSTDRSKNFKKNTFFDSLHFEIKV